MSATAGRYSLARFNGHVNVPVGDQAALRFSGAIDQNDGFVRNINPDRSFDFQGSNDFQAFRAQGLIEPTPNLSINLKFDWGQMGPTAGQNEQQQPIGVSPDGTQTIEIDSDIFGNSPPASPEDVVNIIGPNAIAHDMVHVLARVDWTASDRLHFTALGGWLESNKLSVENCSNSPDPTCLFSNDADQDNWMIEFRGDWTINDRTRMVAGVTYLEQDIDSTAITPIFFDEASSLAVGFGGDLYSLYFNDTQDLESWAVFSQVEYDITPTVTVIGGLRYTRDKKNFSGFYAEGFLPAQVPIPRDLNEMLAIGDLVLGNDPLFTIFNTETSGNLARFDEGFLNANLQVDWKPTDDLLLYAAYRRGVKSGGFITGNVGFGFPDELRPYDKEVNNAFEVGAKSTLLGGAMRLNGAVFHYRYDDMQNLGFIGLTNVITNNDSRATGAEVEMTASLGEGWDLMFGIGYLNTEVKNLTNAQGVTEDRDLPLAPQWSASASLRYEHPAFGGFLWAQSSARAQTSRYRDALNNPSIELEGFGVTDAQAGFRTADYRWNAYVWMDNLFDRRHTTTQFDLHDLGNVGEKTYSPPRWWGVTLELNF